MHLVEKLRDLLHLIDDYLMDRAGRGELFSKPFLSGGDACDTEPTWPNDRIGRHQNYLILLDFLEPPVGFEPTTC